MHAAEAPAKAAQPGAGGGKATEVAVYEGQGMLTTVTTAPLELYSSDPDRCATFLGNDGHIRA